VRKIEHELKREFPFAAIERTNGGHYRLRLPNGKFVFAPSTPGDRLSLQNTRSEVRRRMLEDRRK
jgi:hypothetical protein